MQQKQIQKTQHVKIKNIEAKIPDITSSSLKAKINEVKGEIPNIINSASTAAFTAVEKNAQCQ